MKPHHKMRVWDGKEFWYMDDLLEFQPWKNGNGSRVNSNWFARNPNAVFEQCTGLQDKNGKLIYEGDVVITRHGSGMKITWFVGYGESVIFFDDVESELIGFTMLSKNSSPEPFGRSADGCEYEIIGNIHENANLLGEK